MIDIKRLHQESIQRILDDLESSCQGYPLNPDDKHLAEIPAIELRRQLIDRKQRNKELSPLVQAICHFHDKQLQDRNSHYALTDVLTKNALLKAEALEQQVTPDNVDDYPLYGFVLSIKECIRMKGYVSTCGLVNHMKPCDHDTPLIDYLERKGAVIISRGNVPQLLFAMESWNNIYGQTANPWNKERSSGGSSGGEAALIALGHVNGGFGSDIAGSLRIPALFCGICSLNLSFERIDFTAHAMMMENAEDFPLLPDSQHYIIPSIGPMAKNVSDLATLTEVYVKFYETNLRMVPVPWCTTPKKVLRVGVVLEWDNLFEITEVNRRAMRMAVQALSAQGVEAVDIDMRPYIMELIQLVLALFYKSGYMNHLITKYPLKEPLLPVYQTFKKAIGLPLWALYLLRKVIRDPLLQTFVESFYKSKVFNERYLGQKVEAIKKRLFEQMKKAGIEVLLCPGMMPAILKGTSNDNNIWSVYTFVWNGLRFPAGALPITRVQESEQFYDSRLKGPFPESIKRTMQNSKGLPVGIQVVSLPWKEETILEVMKAIESGVNFK